MPHVQRISLVVAIPWAHVAEVQRDGRNAAVCQCAAQADHVVLIAQKSVTDDDAGRGGGFGRLKDAVIKLTASQ